MIEVELTHKKVQHRQFGLGEIIEFSDKWVRILFFESGDIKRFSFPDSFNRYVQIVDDISEIDKVTPFNNFSSIPNITATWQPKDADSSRFNDFCTQSRNSVSKEIELIRKNGSTAYRLFDGICIEIREKSYTYSFECETEIHIPDGTPIYISDGTKKISGTIISSDDFNLIVSLSDNLGQTIPNANLYADAWKLLEALNDRITSMSLSPNRITMSLVCEGYSNIRPLTSLKSGQSTALNMAISQPITFIWGPPGTGKTEVLAKIVLSHISKEHRVLMLSHSNISVDEAILRVCKLESEHIEGRLIRYGYARKKEILEHPYISSYNYALQKNQLLFQKKNQLMDERRTVSFGSTRSIEISNELKKIRNIVAEAEKASVKAASFVATTISKAVVDKTIYESEFDVVIFDEASMAYVPQVVFSSSLAKQNFVCIGDFSQLPPIVNSSEYNQAEFDLNIDIFNYCGIVDAVKHGKAHNWLCMLDVQYRMHPMIANFASDNMYSALLKTHKEIIPSREKINRDLPIKTKALTVFDLSGSMSTCVKTPDHSRINLLSAFVSMGAALVFSRKHDVGIITPYHAQASLLHAMEYDINALPDFKAPITCATVHQFQGSEKDVIIFDTVDCYIQRYPGKLLTSKTNDLANRLFNVALTRAKGKFITVSNVSYMRNKNLSPTLMLHKILNLGRRSEFGCEFTEVENCISNSEHKRFHFYANHDDATTDFIEDIDSAKYEIRIDIPTEMYSNDIYLSTLITSLNRLNTRNVKLYIRTDSKNALPNSLRSLAAIEPKVHDPITIVDNSIVWYGQPLSNANFIIEKAHVLQTKYYPVFRFNGKKTAKFILRALNMNGTLNIPTAFAKSAYTFSEFIYDVKGCPKCGAPLKLSKSQRNGTLFLGCSNFPRCRYCEYVTKELVTDYLYRFDKSGKKCPYDNSTLEAFSNKFGVHVRCCGIRKHTFELDQI